MATVTDSRRPTTLRTYGVWLLGLASLIAFILTIFNYVNPANGIHGTGGALLVAVSTLLMLIASIVIALGWARPPWFHVLLDVLIVLDILGTGVAGYMLDSWVLVILMVIALIGWLVHVAMPNRRPQA